MKITIDKGTFADLISALESILIWRNVNSESKLPSTDQLVFMIRDLRRQANLPSYCYILISDDTSSVVMINEVPYFANLSVHDQQTIFVKAINEWIIKYGGREDNIRCQYLFEQQSTKTKGLRVIIDHGQFGTMEKEFLFSKYIITPA